MEKNTKALTKKPKKKSTKISSLPDNHLFYSDIKGNKGSVSVSKKKKVKKPKKSKEPKLERLPLRLVQTEIKEKESNSKKKKKSSLSKHELSYINKQVELIKAKQEAANQRKKKQQENQYDLHSMDLWGTSNASIPSNPTPVSSQSNERNESSISNSTFPRSSSSESLLVLPKKDENENTTTTSPSPSPSTFLPEPISIHVPSTLKDVPKAKLYQPAVDPGHPGTSYQPLKFDREALLNSSSDKKLIKRIQYLQKVKSMSESLKFKKLKKRFSRLAKKQMQLQLLNEKRVKQEEKKRRAQLKKSAVEVNDSKTLEDINQESMHVTSLEPMKPLPTPRVTHKERLKRKRALLAKKQHHVAFLKRHSSFNEKKFDKKLKQFELQLLQRKLRSLRRSQLKLNKRSLTQRLSKHKFTPTPIEEEIPNVPPPSSLRTLQPLGNLFKDRYESLIKRNIIEPRVRNLSRHKKAAQFVLKTTYRGA